MEQYFIKYREGIIGQESSIKTPLHDSIDLIYADWTASGRMYLPIEERLQKEILPFVANTHTDTNYTGSKMTYAYHKAQEIIKDHVGANENDVLISSNSGMTGVVNKFQRILGIKIHESFEKEIQIKEEDRPIVFISHMEHHSNQTSWIETTADVVVVEPNEKGLVCIENFRKTIERYSNRKNKIVAITSCSNVTGLMTPYMEIAEVIHESNGLCFVDFACSAPYVDINMHPENEKQYLDAIYFSPHKFLGGPGTTGILVFNKNLYTNSIPDNPGGGTVDWTNPWGEHKYVDNIEAREDGGTPSFLQTIKAAMCMQLKNEMGVTNIHNREAEILKMVWESLDTIPNLHMLADEHKNRLTIFSFYIDNLHYNLGVKMLNDHFGIQTRGGCSCAGTYGHYLLNVTQEYSNEITSQISTGNCASKPGWIRLSIHPTQSNTEIAYILESIHSLAKNYQEWSSAYDINLTTGVIKHKNNAALLELEKDINSCFSKSFA